MKKILALFLGVIMLFSFAGCKSEKSLLDDVDKLSKKIEGKTSEQVEKILGTPESVLSGLYGDCYTNTKGNAVVIYYSPEGKVTEVHEYEPVYDKAPEPELRPYLQDFAKDLDVNVQYIRTNGYDPDVTYPQAFIVSNREELESYYEKAKDKYDLKRKEYPYSDETIGFLDAIDKYDVKFFEEHCLMIILLEEGSGSVRHEVTSVTAYPSILDRVADFIKPSIKRIVPEVGTCDMAEWHILIEMDREYAFADILETDFTN